MNNLTKQQLENLCKKIITENQFEYIKIIGIGGCGAVVKVSRDNNIYAFKIVIPKPGKEIEPELVKEFRGKNLIKILFEGKKSDGDEQDRYYFYVMEYSYFGDIYTFKNYLKDNIIFKENFDAIIGDNLIKFFAQQLINAIKTLYQGDLVHFDIKPLNILIFKGLEIKLIDFSFLRKLIPDKKQVIRGGTEGYFSPENYYNYNEEMENDTLRKQDYFAIGVTLYNLKYGKSFNINYKKVKDQKTAYNYYCILNDCIQRAMNYIRSQPFQDKDFADFLCNLIQPHPEERFDFEHIIRNKWLNKHTKEIKKISDLNNFDEDNLLLELQKGDFLINYKETIRKKFNDKNKAKNEKYKYNKKGKFTFVKKS